MPGHSPQTRSKLLVDWNIQGRLILRLAAYWLLYHLVVWNGLFAFQYSQHCLAATNVQPLGEFYRDFCARHAAVALFAVALLPMFFIDLLRLTHRIAGPIVRIRATLRRMAAGETVHPIHLRPGDLLTEIRDALNEYIATYQQVQKGQIQAERLTATEADLIQQIVMLRQSLDEPAPDVSESRPLKQTGATRSRTASGSAAFAGLQLTGDTAN